MVIDSSYALALVKRQVKIINRRIETYNKKENCTSVKKSRKKWFKCQEEKILVQGVLADKSKVKNGYLYAMLVPVPGKPEFVIDLIKVDIKTFAIEALTASAVIPYHFMARLLQLKKTDDFNNLTDVINEIVLSTKGMVDYYLDSDKCHPSDFDLYIKDIGFVPVTLVEQGDFEPPQLILKTIIGVEQFNRGGKHERFYQEYVSGEDCSGCFIPYEEICETEEERMTG